MVRTLSNAFDLDRIHQAYLLTGVRGVGKTTTARILARAFNYELPARGRPSRGRRARPSTWTSSACIARRSSNRATSTCIEMDAASHTGIDDVREIIDGARYRPVMARTKVYIIDEVHMLSKSAFNGLLKTLEEPPDHVKFLFATTEIDKVPVTVRSRCQRFDLRRIDAGALIALISRRICAKEGVDDRAGGAGADRARGGRLGARRAVAARSGDRAWRRAWAGAGRRSRPKRCAPMLGLADHGRVIDLFEAVMRGEIAAALGGSEGPVRRRRRSRRGPRRAGRIRPSRHKAEARARRAVEDAAIAPQERARGAAFAETLSMPVLTRAWQLLSKGLQEVQGSRSPARRRRHGPGAPRLRRRSADAGRGPAQACARSSNEFRGAGRGP